MADYEILVGDYGTQQTTPIAISMNWGDRLEIGSGSSGNNHYARRLSSGTNYWTNTANGSASGTGDRAFNGQNTYVYYYAHGTVGDSDTSPTALSRIEVYKEQTPGVYALWFLLDVTLSWANTTASLAAGPHADGSTVNLTYTNNYGDSVKPNLSFNSTGSPPTWGSNSDVLTPGTNQTYAVTANIGGKTLNSNGAYLAGIGVKLGALSGSYIAATTAQEIVYEPVVRGTPSISNSSNDDTNGDCTFTASATGSTLWPQPATSTTGFDDFRFRIDNSASASLCTARGVPAPGTVVQSFLNGNTCTLGGEYRGIPIEVQTRVQGPYNNTGGSGYTAPVTAPIIAPDRDITVNGFSPASPATSSAFSDTLSGNTWISSGQTTETIAIAGAQVGDSIRVIKDSNGANLVSFFEITSTSFNIVVPTSQAEFPGGQSELVKVQIKRTIANGGDNSNATALAFTLTRNLNQATGRLLTDQASSDITFEQTTNIGATAYIAAADGSTGSDTAVDIDLSGTVSGEDYRVVVTSGTTNGGGTSFTGVTATGTTLSYFLAESRLPNVNSTVSYKIQARDNSATGDGVWYDCFHEILGQYIPGNNAVFTITRDDYVAVDNTTGQIILSGTGVVNLGVPFQNYLIGNSNTTTDPDLDVSNTETNQEYRINNGQAPGSGGEVIYYSFGTGNSALSDTVTNSDIVTGTGINFFLYTRVPKTQNGTGVWESCFDQSNGTTIVFAFIDREAALVSPTVATNVSIASTNYGLLIPYVFLTDSGAATDAGNLQLAWSTSTSTPSGWYNVYTGGLNRNGWYYSGDATYLKVAQTIYVGIRRVSVVTGAGSTPNYGSVTTTTSTLVKTPGGNGARGFLNQNNGNLTADFISNNDEILLEQSDTINETVTFDQLTNTSGDVIDLNDSSGSSAFFFTNVTLQTQYGIDVASGTTSNGDIAGDTITSFRLPIGDTQDTYTLFNPGDLPTTGNRVDYEFWRRQEVSQGGNGTKVYPSNTNLSEFYARRRAPVDEDITASFLKPTIGGLDSSTTITIADGNSTTDYRIVCTARTGSSPTVGGATASRTGNGDIVLSGSNLGLPSPQGEEATYKVQFRETGQSGAWADCTGTNATFTLGRFENLSLSGTSGNLTDVPISSVVNSAQVTLDGVVGTAQATLSKTGNATVKLVKNTGPGVLPASTPIDVVDGDTLYIEFTMTANYSETTSATLDIEQNSLPLQTGLTFSATSESSPTGTPGGGGGTGNYGLEIRDSSGDIILTNSDLVGDFCYPDTVTVANGANTGISGVNAKGGNIVLILGDQNPFVGSGRAEAVLENSGTQVRINLIDYTNNTGGDLTYDVLVFNL